MENDKVRLLNLVKEKVNFAIEKGQNAFLNVPNEINIELLKKNFPNSCFLDINEAVEIKGYDVKVNVDIDKEKVKIDVDEGNPIIKIKKHKNKLKVKAKGINAIDLKEGFIKDIKAEIKENIDFHVEKLQGKFEYNKKEKKFNWNAPEWYKQLCNLCESKPSENHVLFLEGITNKPDIRIQLIFDIISNNGQFGTFPKNCIVCGIGHEGDLRKNIPAVLLNKFLFIFDIAKAEKEGNLYNKDEIVILRDTNNYDDDIELE